MEFDLSCKKIDVTPDLSDLVDDLVDHVPGHQKEVLCKLDRIQLQSNLFSIGYAAVMTDDKGQPGTIVGLRASALKGDPLSWKEQLNFGLVNAADRDFHISATGPKVKLEVRGARNSLMVYVMTHELSHIIDHLNNVTREDNCTRINPTEDSCVLDADSYAALSWPNPATVIDEDDSVQHPHDIRPLELLAKYPYIKNTCYYYCVGPAILGEAKAIYDQIMMTSFFTPYSTINSYEDFAEASAVYLLRDVLTFEIVGSDGKVLFDAKQVIANKSSEMKLQWLKQFYERSDLKIH